jgi:hypothetical protein
MDRLSTGYFAQNDFAGNLGRAIDIGIDGPTPQTNPGRPGQGGMVGAPVVTSALCEYRTEGRRRAPGRGVRLVPQ